MVIMVLSQYAALVRPCSDLLFKLDMLVKLFWDRVDLLVGGQRREVNIVESFVDSRYIILNLFQWFLKWNHLRTVWLRLNQLHSF